MTRAQEQPMDFITIVSGLPRSGTSMMMKMLEAGGIPPLTDHIRTADADNPEGYYEFERVKALPSGDHAWLKEAHGKTLKVISALLEHLPPDYPYRVLFMKRNMGEILASQNRMLKRAGKPEGKNDETMARIYQKHLAKVEAWLKDQPNIQVLYVNYNDLLREPGPQLVEIQRFLGLDSNAPKMAGVINANLYRQRSDEANA